MNKIYPLVVIFLLCITGCKNTNTPDVSDIEADVQTIRTEEDLASAKDIPDLKKIIDKNPAFYKTYLDEVLGIQGISQDSQLIQLNLFLKDSVVTELNNKIKSKFGNLSDVKAETEQMFRYLKYYFPEKIKKTPKIYTFISQFGYQLFIFEDGDGQDGIGIGLDMFLHPDIHYKMLDPENTNFSDYITRSWDKSHITKKLADIYVADLTGNPPGHRLIDQMIHNGKQMYITKLLLPEVSDTVITEYSAEQLDWCKNNELQMWSFFMDNKMFFETNVSKVGKYINPSPNSPDMPAEAPGRTANYLGWKIVSAYMDKYPSTTIKDLLKMTDSQALLEKSKYKPERK